MIAGHRLVMVVARQMVELAEYNLMRFTARYLVRFH